MMGSRLTLTLIFNKYPFVYYYDNMHPSESESDLPPPSSLLPPPSHDEQRPGRPIFIPKAAYRDETLVPLSTNRHMSNPDKHGLLMLCACILTLLPLGLFLGGHHWKIKYQRWMKHHGKSTPSGNQSPIDPVIKPYSSVDALKQKVIEAEKLHAEEFTVAPTSEASVTPTPAPFSQ